MTSAAINAAPSPAITANYNGEDFFLVEGTLSELQVARTKVNLLAQIEKNLQAKNLATGVAAVVEGMYGMVANSASLALYDGEDMYNFAAVVGEHIVCGTFEHADQFKNGEVIKAVVSKRGEVLYVHSIMQAKTQQFYMPLGVFAGSGALFKHCMNVAWGFTIFGWICAFGTFFFLGAYTNHSSNSSKEGVIFISLMSLIMPPAMMFPMELWTYRSFRGTGGYAAAIFKTFGFPKSNRIDLRNVGCMNFEKTGWKQAWQADLMLKKLAGK